MSPTGRLHATLDQSYDRGGGGYLQPAPRAQHAGHAGATDRHAAQHGDEAPRISQPTRVRGVSTFLDKNRRCIGKSQSTRPPKRTQRTPHRQASASSGPRTSSATTSTAQGSVAETMLTYSGDQRARCAPRRSSRAAADRVPLAGGHCVRNG
jgi:hypothetical protein